MFNEELGYIDGGSQALVDALCNGLRHNGGRLTLSNPAIKILIEKNRVKGVETSKGVLDADAVICTVPTPFVSTLVPDLDSALKQRYDEIHNIGVCCLVFKLNKSVTPHFWVNISERDISIPGLIEFSNLRKLESTVVYVPYYMPTSHPKFSWCDDDLIDEAYGYLKRINPELKDTDKVAAHVARLRFAQPVCEPGFASKIPPVQTPILGLQIADTCFYYPEDRGIAESVKMGKAMAERAGLLEEL